jgi:hypothetical protein
MSEPQNKQEISEAMRAGRSVVLAAGPREVPRVPPVPHDVWDLPGGTAWVYLATGNSELTRP